jgi:hypothetical protein
MANVKRWAMLNGKVNTLVKINGKDNTLVDKTITNLPKIPKSILIAKPKVIQDSCHKKRGRKPMTDEEKRESKRQRDEKNKK